MPYNPNIQTSQTISPGANAGAAAIAALGQFTQNAIGIFDNRDRNEISRIQAEADMVRAQGEASRNYGIADLQDAQAQSMRQRLATEELRIKSLEAAGPQVAQTFKQNNELIQSHLAAGKNASAYLALSEFLATTSPTSFDGGADLAANMDAFTRSEVFLYNPELQESFNKLRADLPKMSIEIIGQDGQPNSFMRFNEVKQRFAEGDDSLRKAVWSQTTEADRPKIARMLGLRMADGQFMDLQSSAKINRWENEAQTLEIPKEEYLKFQEDKLKAINDFRTNIEYEAHAAGKQLSPDVIEQAARAKYDAVHGESERKYMYKAAMTKHFPGLNSMQLDEMYEADSLEFQDKRNAKMVEAKVKLRQVEEDKAVQDYIAQNGELSKQDEQSIRQAFRDNNTTQDLLAGMDASTDVERYAGLLSQREEIGRLLAIAEDEANSSHASLVIENLEKGQIAANAKGRFLNPEYKDGDPVKESWITTKTPVAWFTRDPVVTGTVMWQADTAVNDLNRQYNDEINLNPDSPNIEEYRRQRDFAVHVKNLIRTEVRRKDVDLVPDMAGAVKDLFSTDQWQSKSAEKLSSADQKRAREIVDRYFYAIEDRRDGKTDNIQLGHIIAEIGREVNPSVDEMLKKKVHMYRQQHEAIVRSLQHQQGVIFNNNRTTSYAQDLLSGHQPIGVTGAQFNNGTK